MHRRRLRGEPGDPALAHTVPSVRRRHPAGDVVGSRRWGSCDAIGTLRINWPIAKSMNIGIERFDHVADRLTEIDVPASSERLVERRSIEHALQRGQDRFVIRDRCSSRTSSKLVLYPGFMGSLQVFEVRGRVANRIVIQTAPSASESASRAPPRQPIACRSARASCHGHHPSTRALDSRGPSRGRTGSLRTG